MAGASVQAAPKVSSFSAKRDACALARVTSTLLPKSGFSFGLSNHASFSRSFTTLPTRKMHGGLMDSLFTKSAASATVEVHTCCCALVPQRIIATGVSPLLPFSMSLAVIFGRFATPIRNTTVSVAVASCCQLISEFSLVGSSWPVTTAKEAATPLWVTGMPA